MNSRFHYLIVIPPLLFLGLFYFYPLINIFFQSFFPEGSLDLGKLHKLINGSYYYRVLWFTTWQAALSTLITLALALPGAYVFARYDFKGKDLIRILTTVPFILPTVVTAAAFRALLGRNGLVNSIFITLFDLEGPLIDIDQTVWFFLLAHVFYNYTVVLRIVSGFWSNMPKDMVEAAKMLGASGPKAFFMITLPLLRPANLASSLLVFIFCFTSFGVVLILGGPGLATIEVEIYRQALHLFNLPMASALSLIQILFTFSLMYFYTWIERRSAVSLIPEIRDHAGAFMRKSKNRLVIFLNIGFPLLLLGAPILALLISSLLTENGPSLAFYSMLFENRSQSILYVAPVKAIFNSLIYASAATLIAILIGWLSASFLSSNKGYISRFFDPIFMLPLSTSAVTLGFGFIIALDQPPLNLRSSPLLPAIAHAMVAFPFVIRSILPSLRSIPRSLREAATMLGGSPVRVWLSVDWPILSKALLVGAVFAFAISMGEFGATAFVARPQSPTIPLAIYRYLSYPGSMNYGQAMAMSCILMLTTAAGFIFLERVREMQVTG